MIATEFQALGNGGVDIAVGDYADFFYEQATNMASLHLVADGYDAAAGVMEVLSLPSSNITTPQGLEHKVVATPEPQLIQSFNGPYTSNIPLTAWRRWLPSQYCRATASLHPA